MRPRACSGPSSYPYGREVFVKALKGKALQRVAAAHATQDSATVLMLQRRAYFSLWDSGSIGK